MDLSKYARELGENASQAARLLRASPEKSRNAALSALSKIILKDAFAILSAIAAGHTVADACEKAILASPRTLDWPGVIKAWFAVWTQLGWFCRRA